MVPEVYARTPECRTPYFAVRRLPLPAREPARRTRRRPRGPSRSRAPPRTRLINSTPVSSTAVE